MTDSRRFGRFEIRPAERVLVVDEQPAALGSRAFDLLLALVERHDRVVTKDELLDVVWPGLVVEENNLAVHVSALRKVLGPRAIATIPGRGYRFVAPMDTAPSSAALPAGAPSATAAVPHAALPLLTTMLLGRDDDMAALDALMQRSRCVSIVGAGGIGKTTLALAAAHARRADHRDGAAWVELAEIEDPGLMPGAIAQAVGLEVSAGADPMPALIEALKPMQMLLVLDNAEHLRSPVARFVRAVFAATPSVRLLVTSQVALKVDGEQVFRLGPLAVPEAGADVDGALGHGAVALFAEQARAADRRFVVSDTNVEAVIALCRALDGVPLAIRLATARLPLLGLQGLATHLGDRLRVLRNADRDAPARQRTLLGALEWSHGLLGGPEQAVFRRLGVFAGGFPLELASTVAGDDSLDEWAVIDALAELVDRSLVSVEAGEWPRYRLLEAARDYARLQLDAADETHATQRRHAQATAALIDAAYKSYWSMAERAWLERHAAEIDNVRAALDWSTRYDAPLAVRLVGGAGVLFMLLGQAPEARRRFAALHAPAIDAGSTPDTSRYWLERSRLHWGVSNAAMHQFASKALHQFRAAEDARGLYLALRCTTGSDVVAESEAEAGLAEMAALERPDWPPRLHAQRLLAEVSVLRVARRFDRACEVSQAVFAMASHAGLDSLAIAALAGLAGLRLALGDADEALRCARQLIADPRARRGNFVLHALGTMAAAHLSAGDVRAARQAVAGFVAASRSRDWEWMGLYADVFAWLAACEGRAADAARLIGHAENAIDRAGAPAAHSMRARSRVLALIEPVIDAARLRQLRAEGALLDEAGVCTLALADSQTGQRPL